MGRRVRVCVFCGKSATKLTDHLNRVHKLDKQMSHLAKKYTFLRNKTHVLCALCNKLVPLVKGSIGSYQRHITNWHSETDVPIEDLINRAKKQCQEPFPYQLFQASPPIISMPSDRRLQSKSLKLSQ